MTSLEQLDKVIAEKGLDEKSAAKMRSELERQEAQYKDVLGREVDVASFADSYDRRRKLSDEALRQELLESEESRARHGTAQLKEMGAKVVTSSAGLSEKEREIWDAHQAVFGEDKPLFESELKNWVRHGDAKRYEVDAQAEKLGDMTIYSAEDIEKLGGSIYWQGTDRGATSFVAKDAKVTGGRWERVGGGDLEKQLIAGGFSAEQAKEFAGKNDMLVQKGSRRKGLIGRAASAVGLDRMGEKLEENFGKFTATDVMFGDEAAAIFGGEGGNQARTKTLGKVVGEKNVEKLDMVGDVATSIALAALPGGPAVMAGMQAVNQLANAAASDILTGDVNWGETLATTAISAGAGSLAAGAGSMARGLYLGGAGAANELIMGNDWERALVAGASGAAGGYFDLGIGGSALLRSGTAEAMTALGDYGSKQQQAMRGAALVDSFVMASVGVADAYFAKKTGRKVDFGVMKKQRNPNRKFEAGTEIQGARARSDRRMAADERAIQQEFEVASKVKPLFGVSFTEEQREIGVPEGAFGKAGG